MNTPIYSFTAKGYTIKKNIANYFKMKRPFDKQIRGFLLTVK